MVRSTSKPKTGVVAIALLTAVCMLAVSLPGWAQPSGGFGPEFTLSRDDSVVVLEYTRDIDAIEEPDPTPFLRIFGDGTYVVHYPIYMKLAGNWQGRIALTELDALVNTAITSHLLEFDAAAVPLDEISSWAGQYIVEFGGGDQQVGMPVDFTECRLEHLDEQACRGDVYGRVQRSDAQRSPEFADQAGALRLAMQQGLHADVSCRGERLLQYAASEAHGAQFFAG